MKSDKCNLLKCSWSRLRVLDCLFSLGPAHSDSAGPVSLKPCLWRCVPPEIGPAVLILPFCFVLRAGRLGPPLGRQMYRRKEAPISLRTCIELIAT